MDGFKEIDHEEAEVLWQLGVDNLWYRYLHWPEGRLYEWGRGGNHSSPKYHYTWVLAQDYHQGLPHFYVKESE